MSRWLAAVLLAAVLAGVPTTVPGGPGPAALARETAEGATTTESPASDAEPAAVLTTPIVDLLAAFAVPEPVPQAAAWVIVDADTGQVVAGHNAQVRRPVASTIKVLTALSVVRRVDLDEQVVVGDEVLGIGGSSLELVPGETWTVRSLLEGLIVRSGNDAAEALAHHVAGSREGLLRLMEQDAALLGIPDLTLVSVSGLDDANQLSALELATIGRAALQDPDLGPMLGLRSIELPGQGEVPTRNELLLLDASATGIKTGFTTAAGPSLIASADRDGRAMVVVVLGAEEDPARFTESRRLLDHSFDATRPATLAAELTLVVAGGQRDYVLASSPVTVPTAAEVEVHLEVPDRVVEQLTGEVRIDDAVFGEVALPAVGQPPTEVAAGAAVGRALADGVYAAMRAATRAEMLR